MKIISNQRQVHSAPQIEEDGPNDCSEFKRELKIIYNYAKYYINLNLAYNYIKDYLESKKIQLCQHTHTFIDNIWSRLTSLEIIKSTTNRLVNCTNAYACSNLFKLGSGVEYTQLVLLAVAPTALVVTAVAIITIAPGGIVGTVAALITLFIFSTIAGIGAFFLYSKASDIINTISQFIHCDQSKEISQ